MLFFKICLILFLSYYTVSGFQLTTSGFLLFALVSVATSVMICASVSVLKSEGEIAPFEEGEE